MYTTGEGVSGRDVIILIFYRTRTSGTGFFFFLGCSINKINYTFAHYEWYGKKKRWKKNWFSPSINFENCSPTPRLVEKYYNGPIL